MSIRYYPSFRVKTNLTTRGNEYTLNGAAYSGLYYATYDGKFYSGPNPAVGPNERLDPIKSTNNLPKLSKGLIPETRSQFTIKSNVKIQSGDPTQPTSYHPKPTEPDYNRGYFYRFFVKKINEQGYVKEISEQEYVGIEQGTVEYDVSYYQIQSILWKLTGPLNTVRLSQYDIRAGIVDTNKRLIEGADTKFLGLKAFIAEDYAKFARPTTTQ
jgi:hypothetical protein